MKTNISTEQATEKLGFIWAYGGGSSADIQLDACKAASRAWHWQDANAAMARAYQALGAHAPEVPLTAIHSGKHPVQIAAERAMR